MLIVQLSAEGRVLIGPDVEIVVAQIRRGVVRLGIEAPQDVRISRVGIEHGRRTHHAKQEQLTNLRG